MQDKITLEEANKRACVYYPENPRGEGQPYYGGPYGETFKGNVHYSHAIPDVVTPARGYFLVRADGHGSTPAPFREDTDHDDPTTWTADQIRHCYDSDLDMRLRDLAMMTGRSLADIRRILRA